MAEVVEKKVEKAKQSWADESGESDNEDNNKEIGEDLKGEGADAAEPKVVAPPKKDYGPPVQRDRNVYGDFVVTTINIPDVVVPVLEQAQQSDSDEDEESEQEEETKEEVVVEKKGKFGVPTDLLLLFSSRQATQQERAEET